MTDTRELIANLKDVKQAKGLSINDIVELTGNLVSKTTVQRVFADGSEEISFRYEETLRPIANALLNVDTINETDNPEILAMKSLLKYKSQLIDEMENKINELNANFDKEKMAYLEKLDEMRSHYCERLDFANNQIELKDKRMDQLLEAVFVKDKLQQELLNKILNCPCHKGDIK